MAYEIVHVHVFERSVAERTSYHGVYFSADNLGDCRVNFFPHVNLVLVLQEDNADQTCQLKSRHPLACLHGLEVIHFFYSLTKYTNSKKN